MILVLPCTLQMIEQSAYNKGTVVKILHQSVICKKTSRPIFWDAMEQQFQNQVGFRILIFRVWYDVHVALHHAVLLQE